MMSPLWIWPLWLISLLLLCLFGRSDLLTALLLLLPVLIAASAAVSFLASRRVGLRLTAREIAPKRKGVSAELAVRNPGPFPLMQLRCPLTLENRLTGERFTRMATVSLPPFSSRQIALSVGSAHCGQILLTTGRVRAADLTGLLAFPTRAQGRAITTVLPNTFPLRLLPGLHSLSFEESEEYDPSRAGEDVSETYQIREYREGDALRQVHWKLTTKYDNLMIREPGRPIKRSLLLLLDLRRPQGSHPPAACFDAAAEVAVSLSQALLDAGIVHTVAWETADGPIERRTVQNIDDLTMSLPGALSGHGERVPGAEQAAELLLSPEYSRIFAVCVGRPLSPPPGDLRTTVLCCVGRAGEESEAGESLLYFHPRTYPEEVGTLIV
ncbi:MAG: hypothetical protein DBX44_03835 [Oscillospiraceae bacterium]|nr:MAG: hypothetical protein DBX44_03835 [Oscillospiraceae bacterium]